MIGAVEWAGKTRETKNENKNVIKRREAIKLKDQNRDYFRNVRGDKILFEAIGTTVSRCTRE